MRAFIAAIFRTQRGRAALTISLALLVAITADSQATATGNHLWSASFGDGSSQTATSVDIDNGGNAVVTGGMSGTADFGGGPLTSGGDSDIYVAKFDAAGSHLWSKHFGDAASQSGLSVATDSANNVVLAGFFRGTADFGGGVLSAGPSNGDVFVAKFDQDGNHLWSKRFGDSGDQSGIDVATDASGNVLIGGAFMGQIDFGGGPLASAGNTDAFLAKLDAAGNHVWSKRFGDGAQQLPADLAVNSSGEPTLTGTFQGSVNFGGGVLSTAGSEDIFVATFNAAGVHAWSARYGDTNIDRSRAVATTASGDIVITGAISDDLDFGGGALLGTNDDVFVAAFDAAGAHLWSKRFPGSATDQGEGIAVDSGGNVLLTGQFSGNINFGGGLLTSAGVNDVFAATLDSSGNHVWSKRFGSTLDQFGVDVAADPLSGLALAGRFNSSIDFGGGVLTSGGGLDIYVAKLATVVDSDGDGCADDEELGPNEQAGGQRNPLDFFDFYDVNGDSFIDLSDTLLILAHFGHGPNDDAFDQLLDRFIPNPLLPWATSEANDGPDLGDALASLKSFGHDCTPPP